MNNTVYDKAFTEFADLKLLKCGVLNRFLNNTPQMFAGLGPYYIDIPSDFGFKERLNRLCEQYKVKLFYLDFRSVNNYETAKSFMERMVDNPYSIVLMDHINQMPEYEYRPQASSLLLRTWSEKHLYFNDWYEQTEETTTDKWVVFAVSYPSEEITFNAMEHCSFGGHGASCGDILKYAELNNR